MERGTFGRKVGTFWVLFKQDAPTGVTNLCCAAVPSCKTHGRPVAIIILKVSFYSYNLQVGICYY